MGQLQSLVESPRWRMGDAIVGSINRAVGRASRATVADRIRDLAAELSDWEASVLRRPNRRISAEKELRRLAKLLEAIEQVFFSLLGSRRWRIGGIVETAIRPVFSCCLGEPYVSVESVRDLLSCCRCRTDDYVRRPAAATSLADAYYLLAEFHEAEGEWQLAQRAYEAALRYAGPRPILLLRLGCVMARREEWVSALKVFQTIIETDAGNGAPTAPASLEKEAGGHDLARSAFLCARARIEAKEDKWESALVLYEAATRVDPSCAEGHYEIGRIRERNKHAAPSYTPHAGLVLSEQGDWNAAARAYEAAIAIDPNKAKYHLRLAYVCERMRDFRRSAAAYEAALRLKPSDRQCLYSLARAREQALDFEGALDAYRSVLRIEPQHRYARSRMVGLLARLGRWDDIIGILEANTESQHVALRAAASTNTLCGERSRLYGLLRSDVDRDAQDAIRNLLQRARAPDYESLLSIDEWFTLHWRFVSLGWFSLAYELKDIAAGLILKDTENKSLTRCLAIAKALVQLGRKEEAVEHLMQLSRNAAGDAAVRVATQSLLGDICAFYGDFARLSEALALHEGVNTIEAEMLFRELISGRSVAVVGPLDDGLEEGDEIDSFDVVIRTNYLPGSSEVDRVRRFGARTDISYFNGVASQALTAEIENAVRKGAVKMVVLRPMNYAQGKTMIRRPGDLRYNPSESKVMLRARSFALQRILHDILRYGPARVKIFKVDFFVSKDSYAKSYAIRQALGGTDPFAFGAGHDFRADFEFTGRLLKAGLISANEPISRLLRLPVADYLRVLDRWLPSCIDVQGVTLASQQAFSGGR